MRSSFALVDRKGRVKGGKVAHHRLVLVRLVSVNSLGMLTEVVEAGELL
jgi:hypothetical protein